MADNFDLKKFLKESKALENLNPSMKSINENDTREGMKAKIKEMIVAELEEGSSNSEKIRTKYNEMFGKNPQTTFKDVAKALNLPEDEVEMALQSGDFMGGHSMFEIDEIDLNITKSADSSDYQSQYEGEDPEKIEYEEDNYDYSNDFYDGDPNDFGDTDEFDGYGGYDIDEAKKKDEEVEDVEDVEDVEVTDTEEEMPAEEAPATGGGLEDIAADMKGTEADLMDNLMKAFQIAKGMQNEKLETQVGNTLKFFVSEYIGGGEQ